MAFFHSGVGRHGFRAGAVQWCLLLTITMVPSLVAGADLESADLRLAESVLRKGYKLVGVSGVLVRDINRDGRKDIIMAVERSCAEKENEPPCEGEDGAREIEVHYGQRDGGYRLGVRSGLIMRRDEGGMDAEPFKGFTVTPKGSIQVHLSGGAGWVWEYTYTLHFRKDDIYVIGSYAYSCSGARDDVECSKTDVNLLTGRWRRESWIGDGRHKIEEGRVQPRPLCRLGDASVGMDLGDSPSRPD